jgi:hypothetical protein
MRLKFIQNLKVLTFAFPSLMLTPQEQGVESGGKDHEKSICLHVSGIIFQNPDFWSLWIEGEKFTPKNRESKLYDFKVLQVSSDHIKLKFLNTEKSYIIRDSFNPVTGDFCQ